MKSFLAILSIWTFIVIVTPIAMQGVKINDSQSSLDNIRLEIVSKGKSMVKYRTENGNDFSITSENGKVVFMENDWLQDEKGCKPLYSSFKFGQTTLKEIRRKFGTNGFSHQNMGTFKTDTHVIMFNCFEFDSPNNEVLVTITKVSLDDEVTEKNVAEKAKLDALIIADKGYLEREWGEEKLFDPNYHKIKP